MVCIAHLKIFIAHIKRVLLDQVRHGWVARIDVLDAFVGTVLTDVFTWHLESISCRNSQWDGEVSNIDVFLCPLLEVTDEAVEVVPLWHVNC